MRERETGRQIDRQTDRQTDRECERRGGECASGRDRKMDPENLKER